MSAIRYPALYQVNTRVWLTELSDNLGRAAALDDIPAVDFDRLAESGFDWVWLLSIWQTGPAGQRVSRGHSEWRREFEETLPDLREEDVGGSGFAITGYTAHSGLGGDAALARLRERLRERGLRLMLAYLIIRLSIIRGSRIIRGITSPAATRIWRAPRRTTSG
jgi:hypothetical protein